jgi:fatty-acyl-CoA synthase
MIVENQVGAHARCDAREAAPVLLIGEMLANAARVAPDAVAATLDDEQMTFGEIEEQAQRIAHGLRDLGIGRGDRVLWWSDTALEAVPVFAALAKLGAVFAPLNARASVAELVPVARYARPRVLLAGASHAGAAA